MADTVNDAASDYSFDFSPGDEAILCELADAVSEAASTATTRITKNEPESPLPIPPLLSPKSESPENGRDGLETDFTTAFGTGTASAWTRTRTTKPPTPDAVDHDKGNNHASHVNRNTSTQDIGPVRQLESKLETKALAALPTADSILDINAVPPLNKFRSFPRKPLTVTDLTSGAWCELQYYYTLTKLPGGRKAPTEQMTAGTRVHKMLEDQVHETVRIKVATREDAMGVRMWNMIQGLQTLAETGLTREVQVWGIVGGQVVSGVIDGLGWQDPAVEVEASSSEAGPEVKPKKKRGRPRKNKASTVEAPAPQAMDRKVVYLTDVKTRGSKTIPAPSAIIPAKIQLNLYRQFINAMLLDQLNFVKIVRRYGADPDEPFTDEFLAQMAGEMPDSRSPSPSPSPSSEPSQNPQEEQQSQGGQMPELKKEEASSDQPSSSSDSSYMPPSSPDSTSPVMNYRTLRELIQLVKQSLAAAFPQGLESVSPRLCVEYRHRSDGSIVKRFMFDADEQELQDYVMNDLEWWRGERAPNGVSIEDTFKCRTCDFADECQWRLNLDLERLRVAREKLIQKRMVMDGALP